MHAELAISVEELEVVGDRKNVGEAADVGDEIDDAPKHGDGDAPFARLGDFLSISVVEDVGRAQQGLRERFLDLPDLGAVGRRHVVPGPGVESLPGKDPEELLVLGLIREEADVLLELEALLLNEAEGFAVPAFVWDRELVLVDHQPEALAQHEPIMGVDVDGGHELKSISRRISTGASYSGRGHSGRWLVSRAIRAARRPPPHVVEVLARGCSLGPRLVGMVQAQPTSRVHAGVGSHA